MEFCIYVYKHAYGNLNSEPTTKFAIPIVNLQRKANRTLTSECHNSKVIVNKTVNMTQ